MESQPTWHGVCCLRIYTGIVEPMRHDMVFAAEEGVEYRVVYYEDKKGTHVETAVLAAHLTEEEWTRYGDVQVVKIELRSIDPDHKGIAMLIYDDCMMTRSSPCVPVMFRTLYQTGRKKIHRQHLFFDVVFTLRASLTGEAFESVLLPKQDRLIVMSKYLPGCVNKFEQTFEAMERGAWDARLYCQQLADPSRWHSIWRIPADAELSMENLVNSCRIVREDPQGKSNQESSLRERGIKRARTFTMLEIVQSILDTQRESMISGDSLVTQCDEYQIRLTISKRRCE